MANLGKQHRANCIGTLSFPIRQMNKVICRKHHHKHHTLAQGLL